MNRRAFLKSSALSGGTLLLANQAPAAQPRSTAAPIPSPAVSPARTPSSNLPDLSPAQWIWLPSGRTLQNTFVLFRRELHLDSEPLRARGWICADSRYRLEVNGHRVQWGPPPCDPRWTEADPVDLTSLLKPGLNVLGATVLFYGTGDGTWPIGKPGFLFYLEIEHRDGHVEKVVSDPAWKTLLCRAWTPGHYKRWYLRALQEEFDARLYPYGWSAPDFKTGNLWRAAMPLSGSPNQPAVSAGYYEYMLDVGGGPPDAQLRARSIPLLAESLVPARTLTQAFWLHWQTTPQDYFDFRTPEAFSAAPAEMIRETSPGEWSFELEAGRGTALTFEFADQVVGWPGFTIEAPTGTTVELLVHEAHALNGPPLLNTHFDSWTRFICREGKNDFETFDFESLRWLQLHVHNAAGKITIRNVRVRRRVFPWPNPPRLHTGEPDLQRLFDAGINTLNNCAQETLVDGMARERQQYSGDGGHQMHAVHLAFGEQRLPARYLATFSQGITKDGFFLDCWPAYDRLARLVERQLDLSGWGPILDHGVGFNLDCWSHYFYTADLDAVREPYPRLVRFAQYLQKLVDADGLLPVENLGIPSVWIDHIAFKQQRHKQCPFNLYAAAAMQHALAPLCRAFGDDASADAVERFGRGLEAAAVRRFWSPERGLFVDNLPWLAQEKEVRTSDRSLATSILFDQCPQDNSAALRSLVKCPPEMGFSYPANATWRYWALGQAGRADVIVSDLRKRWATMASVKENNTLQEDWDARHDSGQQWSHCAVSPVYLMFHAVMGLRPLAPGFQRYQLRPQLGDLRGLDVTAYTTIGPFRMWTNGDDTRADVSLSVPSTGQGELVVPESQKLNLPPAPAPASPGYRIYKLTPGAEVRIQRPPAEIKPNLPPR